MGGGVAGLDEIEELDPRREIHIHVRQRTGRKTVTTVQGLSPDLDLPKILSSLKKRFSCNGHLTEDEDGGSILQLTGDQRQRVADFLLREEIAIKSGLKIHGA